MKQKIKNALMFVALLFLAAAAESFIQFHYIDM